MPDLSIDDFLEENQQALLARLSVFMGGWTLEATEKVCSGGRMEAWQVLDLLTALMNKSLLIYEEGRYRMLETVQEYAREKLGQSGETEEVEKRHRDYFLTLAEEIVPKLNEAQQGTWLCRLDMEHNNLRSALNWSLQRQEGGTALRLCGALQPFWRARGYIEEGRQWCEATLNLAGASARSAERARVLNATGVLARMQGDYATALAYHEQSLAIRRELGDRLGVAASLNGLGNLAYSQGDYPAARAYYEQSLIIKRETENQTAIAGSLNNLGLVAYHQRDYPSARVYYGQSLAIRHEVGNMNVEAVALLLQGMAEVSAAEGAWETGALLWAVAEALREQIGLVLPFSEQEVLEQDMAATRQALGEEAFSKVWTEGRAMTLERAISYALMKEV
jgi:tetratricopeptide (TPR) repeat protein